MPSRSLGFLHVDLVVVEIEGLNVPILACCERKYGSEAGKSCDERAGVEVVDALELREPLCDESGLILVHAAIHVALDSEDPLASKDVLAGRARDVHIVYQEC